jgi:non-heme chloroperoxidase
VSYYNDWGNGQPIVFSHGWPLDADSWEGQILFLAERGFRWIAHDRRGHGRSSQPSSGHDMDNRADDLASLIEELDLRDAIFFGFSTGGGDVAGYIGRHGTSRVAGADLIAAVPPLMVRTTANPGGLPIDVFDGLRAGERTNRAQLERAARHECGNQGDRQADRRARQGARSAQLELERRHRTTSSERHRRRSRR